ncbi:FAD-dependent oxidoreductase [Aestuariibacter salexigens]|uniref:FAD-dependent oxidoreductase n=1 Tax=Aestuariibacter salexigens TaxID=226010 RepID=UPI0004181CB8|nr:FAD-dependent oxidoreductase [Aestuariibacter salexigens]
MKNYEKKVAIVGGGWYGCHLASYMVHLGMDVTLFERDDDIFTGASGLNQNRLHLGFHYARDYETRLQSRDGFSRFLERYGQFIEDVPNNYYAIPIGDSLLDFKTYKAIMASSGIEFEEISLETLGFELRNVAGVVKTNEKVIKVSEAREFFRKDLEDIIVFNEKISKNDITEKNDSVTVKNARFDFLIDATWSKLFSYDDNIFYEPTILFYYQSVYESFALTLVDGPLASVYPTEDPSICTLSSVPLTPLGKFDNLHDAEKRLSNFSKEEEEKIRLDMENQISKYLPNFKEKFKYLSPQLSMKTKPIGIEENRACYVKGDGRVIKVMSGKIDTIFVAAERVLNIISRNG